MCDTLVAAPEATADKVVLFAKNSDREPGEAQVVEMVRRRDHPGQRRLRCTWITIPQARRTWKTLLCRPFWMWGAEMGTNEWNVVIGNQAVFTRFDVAETGLTGMDLVRIGLERSRNSEEALEVIIDHLERFGQGGRCGYRHHDFRYHSSFVIADPEQAWILETAGPFWAARKVRHVWSLSNALTIGRNFDRISDGAVDFAVDRGWTSSPEAFHFAQAFADRRMDFLAGARRRRRCTLNNLEDTTPELRVSDLIEALRSHNHTAPSRGLRMNMPCAHASWLPTRSAGQTVGSMVSRVTRNDTVHWLTATSSPCLSVFKPLTLDADIDFGPKPTGRYDERSLFWRHENLHRRLLIGRSTLPPAVCDDLESLRGVERAVNRRDRNWADVENAWREHGRRLDQWIDAVGPGRPKFSPFALYWRYQCWLDQMPLTRRRRLRSGLP